MKYVRTFENFDKPFDKKVKLNSLVKYVQEELHFLKEKGEEPKFGGYQYSYWQQYEGDKNHPMNDDFDIEPTEKSTLYRYIKNIINKYRTHDGINPNGKAAVNTIELWINMLAIAEYCFENFGKVNTGPLSAFCMQNFETIIPWKFSNKLVDLNDKTGILED